MSPGAVADDVTPTSKIDDSFSQRPTHYHTTVTITTPTLSAFPGDRLSRVLVNSAAKKHLDFH